MCPWLLPYEPRKDIAGLIQIAAGEEQVRDVSFVLSPLLDLVEIARVRIERACSLFVKPAATHSEDRGFLFARNTTASSAASAAAQVPPIPRNVDVKISLPPERRSSQERSALDAEKASLVVATMPRLASGGNELSNCSNCPTPRLLSIREWGTKEARIGKYSDTKRESPRPCLCRSQGPTSPRKKWKF